MAKLQSSVAALVVGAAGLMGLASTASADGYVRGRAPVAGPCCSWSGFYVGINGGYAWSADDHDVLEFETIQTQGAINPNGRGLFGNLDPAGGFGGVQVGFNAKGCCGPWVFGLEADVQGGDISDSSHGVVNGFFLPVPVPGFAATVDTTTRIGWFGTLRPRVGYAWGNTMVYATGGFAFGQVKHSMRFVDNTNFGAQDNSSESKRGYVVGGGVEHMLSCCWSVKLEYQYINLGAEDWSAPLTFPGFVAGGGAATVFRENIAKDDIDFHTVRVGLNYKFGDRDAKPLK
jgi:outer membrane immunogenic protein